MADSYHPYAYRFVASRPGASPGPVKRLSGCVLSGGTTPFQKRWLPRTVTGLHDLLLRSATRSPNHSAGGRRLCPNMVLNPTEPDVTTGWGSGPISRRLRHSLHLGFDRDDSLAAIEAEEWVAERFQGLHPDAILRVEGLSLRLVLPDDDRRVGGIRRIGDEREADEPGGCEQQGEEFALPALDRLFDRGGIDGAPLDEGIHQRLRRR